MNDLLVVIAAAGVGKRFGGSTPKQYCRVNGKSIMKDL
jgi:4-diphosphocytidyl-2-methyl-D-erithritol synthase